MFGCGGLQPDPSTRAREHLSANDNGRRADEVKAAPMRRPCWAVFKRTATMGGPTNRPRAAARKRRRRAVRLSERLGTVHSMLANAWARLSIWSSGKDFSAALASVIGWFRVPPLNDRNCHAV